MLISSKGIVRYTIASSVNTRTRTNTCGYP